MRIPRISRLRPLGRSPLDDLVDAHTTALTKGTPGLDALLEQYDRATAAEARELFALVEQIAGVLTPVKPDERFVRTLYDELRAAEVPSWTLVERIRHMPRTQLAAGIGGAATLTVTAGVVLYAWKSEGGLMALLRRWMPAA